jgi:argininosuccinate lyase
LAGGVSGTARVGRAIPDTVATVIRLILRERLIAFGEALATTRRTALDLAAAHVTTLMPVYIGGQPAQPSNFGHVLGGLIAPLGRAGSRISSVYAEINRSPLGAGTLASTGMAIERERSADLLGFDGVANNTFDAVAATDHLVAVGDLVATVANVVGRFVSELLIWRRTDPSSFRLTSDWTAETVDLPQLHHPIRLEALRDRTRGVGATADSLRRSASDTPYGPIAWQGSEMLTSLETCLDEGIAILSETTALFGPGLEINRAYLANRAGRNHTTSSDLADFLMIEEQLDPETAQTIAARTIARIVAEGIEVSGITPEIIDGAALLVIGRELKVEFETISRYLAPRRFLERRTATGSPSAPATRAYLDQEVIRLGTDQRWLTGTRERLNTVDRSLRQAIDEAHAAGEE